MDNILSKEEVEKYIELLEENVGYKITLTNDTYYGNAINLSGLWSKTPIKCTIGIDNEAWDEEGNFNINPKKLGTEIRDGIIKFTSKDKNEVQIWTDGVLATMKMLNRWSR
jgi:hypothetical protein